MSTKGGKKGGAAASASQTPVIANISSSAGRPGSPLSPTRFTRIQEKIDLQNLNDRLACYIDRVRHLETENSRLTREVQTSQEVVTREVTSIKSMYEHELSDARKLLDETAHEKAKLEIDTKRLWEENDELRAKLEKKSKDLFLAENSTRVAETRLADIQTKCNQALSDRKKIADELKDAEKELDQLRNQVDELRKCLEEETLSRVDLENTLQSLKEELAFNAQVYQQERLETRSRREVDIHELDGRLAEQYEAKLQESLQELRDQYESQMANNRGEIEMLYESKIKGLQNAAARNSQATTSAIEELRQTRSRMDSLSSRINELEAINGGLQARTRDLEKMLEDERLRHSEDLALMENELTRLRDEMAQQLQEYQDLMDIKISLDLEISAYRKLLEGEEARLNITPSQSPTPSAPAATRSSRTPIRRTPVRLGSKRKRTVLEESEVSMSDFVTNSGATGDIEISEVCPEGKFVKLHNKGAKEVSLSGWQLVRKAGDLETNFKFHRSVKLDPGATTTVWSSDLGLTHEPPTNIVMKGQKWFVADYMTTALSNSNGEEVAGSERKRSQMSAASSRQRESGYLDVEEFLHQKGDPHAAEEDRCSIM